MAAKRGTSKYFSNKQEKSVAKELDAKTVIASGALWGSKGDVRTNDLLIECKTTGKDFYTLTNKTWEKIRKEAIKDSLRTPVMCIRLNNDPEKQIAVFNRNDFNEYKLFKEYWYEPIFSARHTTKNSFRVQSKCLYGLANYSDKTLFCDNFGESGVCFHLMPWGDFVTMINGGVQ